ncbi:ATP-dependent metallopeptidase FtsH/Yme1/Tma family protein [bacterium]|nr:ATP-dependent metallopeptidase FtsH/Yme1/Tma family protein [bacterium]
MDRRISSLIFWIILFFFFLLVMRGGLNYNIGVEKYSYSEFIEKVRRGEVLKCDIGRGEITGELKNGTRFTTHFIPELTGPELEKELIKNGVRFNYKTPILSEGWQNFLFYLVLPLIMLVIFWSLFIRGMQAGNREAFTFAKSRARKYSPANIPKVTFNDVAGADEAKQELQEIVEFLKNPRKFQALGAKIPKGVLLYGPPGCGKTLLARAVAGEANVPFFHISGSEFVEMFVGVGAARVRDLFEQAKANAPCLVFIDEIDAVGRQRGTGLGGGHDEREQTLNQILAEMDGFDPNIGVIVLAATNRPDVLDPALLRPGRFDRRIVIDHPDLKGRLEILKVHARNKPLAEDVDLEMIARRTPGFSGADLANLLNEAALLAARLGKDKITMAEIEEAIERVVAGPQRRSRVISEKEKRLVAYHESGHALVAKMLPNANPVHKISILPRGMALGYTLQFPEQDKYLLTKSELMDEISALLAGRAAEELVFGETTTGAQNDLQRATDMARRMVCELGMSEKIGPITLGRRHGNPFLGRDIFEDRNYSDEVARLIDEEVKNIIETNYKRAKELLQNNRDKLEKLVQILLQKETLEKEEIDSLLSDGENTEQSQLQ